MADQIIPKTATPGGTLILSGIQHEQADAVLASADSHGMCLIGKRQLGDWVALCFER